MKLEVTKSTIRSVTTKLVARLNAMGLVTKSGLPVVVDHGYEGLAAMLGFRTQHVMRGLLEDDKAGLAARESWISLANSQGWNDATQIVLLEGFLADEGLLAQFVAYAQAVAVDENAQLADFPSAYGKAYSLAADAIAARLRLLELLGYVVSLPEHPMSGWAWHYQQIAGGDDYLTQADAVMSAEGDAVDRVYEIKRSDLGGWYWEIGDEASVDFVTKEQARSAAVRDFHALGHQWSALISARYEIVPDADRPGVWIWKTAGAGSEITFDNKAAAIRDAWNNSGLDQGGTQ